MMPVIQLPTVDTGAFRFGAASTQQKPARPLPPTWQERIRTIFPDYVTRPFSEPHVKLWQWADSIDKDAAPLPFVAIWPRGRGKSTNAELICADFGIRQARNYIGYVCETQEQADKHVATIAQMIEGETVATYAPALGNPRVGSNGSKTWNRKIVRTSAGIIYEALGLNKAIRGGKIGWARFDAFVFDDIDDKHDTEDAIKKKQDIITTSILPAGTPGCAILFCQNLIHPDSIAHRLSKRTGERGAADYLANRIISGPHPAVEDLKYAFHVEGDAIQWHITDGRSLWEGWSLADCKQEINREGPTAFRLESQHDIEADNPNALLTSDILNATRTTSHPDLIRAAVAVDPSGGAGQCGIIGGGTARIGQNLHGFIVTDASTPKGTPAGDWGTAVLRTYHSIGADVIYVERNFGGDMAENTIRTAVLLDGEGNVILKGTNVPIVEVTASRGKEVRAQPVASLYQRGMIHHVGFLPELERQWTKWEPGDKPSPDRLDAAVWLMTGLGLVSGYDIPYDTVRGLGTVENFTSPWE